MTAGSNSYGYDANGNMTSRNGSSIGYTSYNLPSVINGGSGTSSSLSYGAFRNRYKQVAVTPGGTETTIYVAGLLEKVTRGSQIEYRHYIASGKGTAAIHTRVAGGASSTYYLHRDHLGSPELITDSSGNEVVRPSFAAYGERRDGNDWSGPPSASDLTNIANITRRGFTGHEHLDSVGLIHMNGRVYEPVAGRFLGVDPILAMGNSQDVNSYSYAWNNPLNVTDPSGLADVTEVTPKRPVNPLPAGGPRCITCDGYSLSGDALAEFLNIDWADPGDLWSTIDNVRSWVLFNPGDDVDVITQNPEWDGGGGDGKGVQYGVQVEAREPGFIDFLLTLSSSVELTYGNESWSLAFCNVTLCGFTDAANAASHGDYRQASAAAFFAVLKPARAARSVGHHADPKFLGGARNQPLTNVAEEVHKNLHRDLNNFLRTRMDEFGNHMRPQRGNSGQVIRQNFSRQERLEALRDFYRGPGAKYTDAARDFFNQHPRL